MQVKKVYCKTAHAFKMQTWIQHKEATNLKLKYWIFGPDQFECIKYCSYLNNWLCVWGGMHRYVYPLDFFGVFFCSGGVGGLLLFFFKDFWVTMKSSQELSSFDARQ